MLAHAAGLPVEEVAVLVISTGGGILLAARVAVARLRPTRAPRPVARVTTRRRPA